jgi:MFS family permease
LAYAEQPKSSNPPAARALVFVSLAVLLASSVWFSGTAAAPLLRREWSLTDGQSAWLTIAVQLGFITGTFLYAFLNLADRFNARRVFFCSAIAAAFFNAGFAWLARGLVMAVAMRFLTGVMLAGVYPVGMKIVASWFQSGLGWRLGVMVGALTLGTASPYLIQAAGAEFDWRLLVALASLSAAAGGALIMLAVTDGPHLKRRAEFDWRMMFKVFRHRPFRYTAFGYFGHMWELYAFWSLVAFYLAARFEADGTGARSFLPLLSFVAIGAGAIGCVAGGWISRRVGERAVALVSLIVSATCCALSGLAFALATGPLLVFIIVWGFFVVSDSPQFSALAARYCPPDYTGTALTVQNGIGFAITVVSIQMLPLVSATTGWRYAFMFLTVGPVLGAYFMSRLGKV